MHILRLCTVTLYNFIRIGPAVEEELRLQDIWTDRRTRTDGRTGILLLHAHLQVVYCNCVKFHHNRSSRYITGLPVGRDVTRHHMANILIGYPGLFELGHKNGLKSRTLGRLVI